MAAQPTRGGRPPKPSQDPGPGYEWVWDSAKNKWVKKKKATSTTQTRPVSPQQRQEGTQTTQQYRPGQTVGGPNRRLPNGGAVVDGVYIPPGTTFGTNRRPQTQQQVPPAAAPATAAAQTPAGTTQTTQTTGGGSTAPRPDLFGPGDMVQVPATGELPAPVEEEVPPVDDATQALIAWQQAQAAMVQQERQESARAVITSLLADYGLDTLADTVWQWIQGGDTESASLIQRIRKTNEYQQRFPAMEMRRAAGMNMISERDYIGLENRYRQSLRAAGLPPGLFDQPEELSRLIGFDVSPDELNARIDEGYQQVARSNPEVVRQMTRLYGVTEGELVGYFLDPERTLPMLTRRARAAQIAGQGTLQAGIEITAGQAEELATQGITQQQAQTSFQAIAGAQELFGGLAGTTEQAIGTEEQIAGVFGTSAAAQQRIRQRTRERQSVFEAGGRFAAGQGGTVTGLQ